jgi:hypothetical protein
MRKLMVGLAALLLGGVLLWPALARAATLVVVEAVGINLTPGAQIDGDKPLPLTAGQVVTLISPSGQIVKLQGPRQGPPAPDAPAASTVNVAAALRTLVTQRLSTSNELGVVRGATPEPVPPTPWLVDVTHDGERCVPAGRPIVFWRPGGGGQLTMTIAPDDRSWLATAEWQAGAERVMVPESIPLRDRATYFIKLGKGREHAITLVLLPRALANDAMRAAWMIEAGCATQVKSLLRVASR